MAGHRLLAGLFLAYHFKVATAASSAEIGTWFFLGPFQCGKTELDGNPVDIMQVPVADRTTYFSELSDSGKVGWSAVGKGSGRVHVAPRINWNKVIQSINSIEAYKFQGWAVSEVAVQEEGEFVLSCPGVHTIQLDDDRFLHGDIYSTGQVSGSDIGFEIARAFLVHGAAGVRIIPVYPSNYLLYALGPTTRFTKMCT